jgi:hypothetical protein
MAMNGTDFVEGQLDIFVRCTGSRSTRSLLPHRIPNPLEKCVRDVSEPLYQNRQYRANGITGTATISLCGSAL